MEEIIIECISEGFEATGYDDNDGDQTALYVDDYGLHEVYTHIL